MKLCIRKSDGAIFKPSYPDNWSDADAIAACFTGSKKFYFRRVNWNPGRLFPWPKLGKWEETGEIWEPESGEFEVTDV